MKQSTLIDLIAILFMILFLYTGVSKLMEISVFRSEISTVPIVGNAAIPISWALPILELSISILLFWPAWRLRGFYAALAVMLIFTSYVVYILNIDENLPCSCGGIISLLSWKQHLIFNSIMTALAATAIYMERKVTKFKHLTRANW